MLLKWEPIAREVFFGYRNDDGRDVGEEVRLSVRISDGHMMMPKAMLCLEWSFERDGNEYQNGLTVDPINVDDEVRKHVIDGAQKLAAQCVQTIILLEARAA